jgi:hypothetical protein
MVNPLPYQESLRFVRGNPYLSARSLPSWTRLHLHHLTVYCFTMAGDTGLTSSTVQVWECPLGLQYGFNLAKSINAPNGRAILGWQRDQHLNPFGTGVQHLHRLRIPLLMPTPLHIHSICSCKDTTFCHFGYEQSLQKPPGPWRSDPRT